MSRLESPLNATAPVAQLDPDFRPQHRDGPPEMFGVLYAAHDHDVGAVLHQRTAGHPQQHHLAGDQLSDDGEVFAAMPLRPRVATPSARGESPGCC